MYTRQRAFEPFMAVILTLAAVFLIFIAPGFLKMSYVFFLYLAFLVGMVYAVVRNKEDFLVVLFILSLCFSAFTINVERYTPSLGNLIPRILPADLILAALVVIRMAGMGLHRWRPVFPRMGNSAFLLLIGSAFLSFIAVSPWFGAYQTSGFYDLYTLIRGYLIFLFFYNYLETRGKYRVVVGTLGAVVVMEFTFMLYQWMTGDFLGLGGMMYSDLESTRILEYGESRRAFGTFMFPSIAAGVITIILPVVLAYTSSMKTGDRLLLISRYAVLILGPGCILLSGARVSLIALLTIIPGFLVLVAGRLGQREFMRTMARFILLFFAAGLIISLFLPVFNHWAERFSHEDLMENSLNFRLLIYRMGLRAFELHPFLGVGWGNGDEYGHTLLMGNEFELYQVGLHNGYIRMLVETGLIGLVVYLAWYIILFRAGLRRLPDGNRAHQFAYLGGILTVVATQFLLVDSQGVLLRNEAEYMFFCLCMAFMRGYDDLAASRELVRDQWGRIGSRAVVSGLPPVSPLVPGG